MGPFVHWGSKYPVYEGCSEAAAEPLRLRNALGVIPVSFLKTLLNVERELNPTSKAMVVMEAFVELSRRLASLIRYSLTKSKKFVWRNCEKVSDKWFSVVRDSSAKRRSDKSLSA